jgi:hypothetical protein
LFSTRLRDPPSATPCPALKAIVLLRITESVPAR